MPMGLRHPGPWSCSALRISGLRSANAARPHIRDRAVAGPAPRGVERHLRDAAPVDADRRQDPARPEPLGQPRLERDSLRHAPRLDDLADSLRDPGVSDRLRLHRSPAADPDERRRRRRRCAAAPVRRVVLRATLERARQARAATSGSTRRPTRLQDPIPFEKDERHASYDPDYANRFWRVLLQSDRVFKRFRARFIGKCSPVHFFWGAPDLAVTRFSGRPAPEHPGGVPHLPDPVTREAYSHEGQQLRVLAGWRRGGVSRVLLVRLPGAPRFRGGSGPACRRLLQPRSRRIPPAVRRGPPGRSRPTTPSSSSCSRPTKPPRTWRRGIGTPWSARSPFTGPSDTQS